MLFRRLMTLLFPRTTPSHDSALQLPRLGESRPHGHFREFTAPRRLQRGGMPSRRAGTVANGHLDGIIPMSGEKIP